jgi:hypothetical protein
MGRIFILAATKMEVDPVAQLLGVARGECASKAGPITAGPNQVEFFFTGIGPRQARERVAEILSNGQQRPPAGDQKRDKPDAVMVIGLCGGLTDSLPEMTIVTYSACVSESGGGIPYPCAPEISAQVTALLNAQNVPSRSVVGVTSPRIAVTRDDKLQLAQTGAQVVDMESYEILSAAHESGVPALVVRVVSDSLGRKLPDFNRALNPDGTVNNGKALRVMLGSPVLTARAYVANKRAARHLANALKVVLSADLPRLQ